MNRYQLEVAESDRRYQQAVRASSFLGAMALVVGALWGAGLPPSQWWAKTKSLFADVDQQTSTSDLLLSRGRHETPKTVENSPPIAGSKLPLGTQSSISPTPQPLHLVSTTPGRSASEGTARIGANPESPQTYAAGAILVNGSRLVEIFDDRVVLARGDSRYTLFMSGREQAGRHELALVGGQTMEVPAKPNMYKDRVTDIIRSMPYYEDELLVGVQLFPGRDAVSFAQLGLQASDVVVSIDGASISDHGNFLGHLRKVTDGGTINVTLRRGSQTMSLALDGAAVPAVNQ